MNFSMPGSSGFGGTLADALRYAQTIEKKAQTEKEFNLTTTDLLLDTPLGANFVNNLFINGTTDINSLVVLTGAIPSTAIPNRGGSIFQQQPTLSPLGARANFNPMASSSLQSPLYRFAEPPQKEEPLLPLSKNTAPSIEIKDGVPFELKGDARFSEINTMVNKALQGTAPTADNRIELQHGQALKSLQSIDPKLAKEVTEQLKQKEATKSPKD